MTFSTNLPLQINNRLHKLLLSFSFLLFGLSFTMAQDGAALDFDGVDDFVQLGNTNLTAAFTIEAWVKPTEKTDFSTIISNKTGGGANPGYSFTINSFESNDGKLVLETQGATAVTDAKAITWGEWQHIAVTSDGMTAKFYVNGIEQAANNENTVNLVETPNSGKIGDFASYLGDGKYKGQMDEFRVWLTEKSQLEIQDQMACEITGNDTNLGVLFRFNQGIASGDNTGMTTLIDSGPNNFDATLINFALNGSTSNFVAPGGVSIGCNDIAGGALDFNGMDNSVGIGDLQLTTGFTIEAWVRPEERTDFSTIVSNKTGGLENPGYTFAINTFQNNDGKLLLETQNGFAVTDEQAITWGVWQHIAVTTDGLSAKFYVNGIEQAATNENTVSLAASPNTTNIGDFFEYFANGKFDGRMDELRVWNFIKTQTQIQDQMNCALVGGDPELLAYYSFDQGIAAGDNSSMTMLDATTGSNGTLNSFGLLGSTGNFVLGHIEDEACMVSSSNNLNRAQLPVGDLFPNPIQQGDRVQVQLSTSQSAPLSIRIYNTIGQLMHQQNEATFHGEQLINIASADLTSGIYWVQFSQGDQLAQRKLVIQ